MEKFIRSNVIPKQTYHETVIKEVDSLKNQAENAGLLGISKGADRFFIAQDKEQVHHVSGLRMLDPVFDNTTEDQAKQLQQMCPTGHSMMNFMLMKPEVHQGIGKGKDTIHNWLRAQGLEPSGDIKPGTFVELTESVRNAPFEQKVAVMQHYRDNILPVIKEKVNDLMNETLNSMYDRTLAGARNVDAIMNLMAA